MELSSGRFQPSLLESLPPFLPTHIHLLAMMSPFLLHLKVQPAEWPVASLGAKWTPSPQAAGRCPCELTWLCSAVCLPLLFSLTSLLTSQPPGEFGGGGTSSLVSGTAVGGVSPSHFPHTVQWCCAMIRASLPALEGLGLGVQVSHSLYLHKSPRSPRPLTWGKGPQAKF